MSSFSTERKRKLQDSLKEWNRRKDLMVFQNPDGLALDGFFSFFSLMGKKLFLTVTYTSSLSTVRHQFWTRGYCNPEWSENMSFLNYGRQKLTVGHCQYWLVFQRNNQCHKWELKGKLTKPTWLVINDVFLLFSEAKYQTNWVRYQSYVFIYT